MIKRIIWEETYLWVRGVGIVFIKDEETLEIANKMVDIMRKKVKGMLLK